MGFPHVSRSLQLGSLLPPAKYEVLGQAVHALSLFFHFDQPYSMFYVRPTLASTAKRDLEKRKVGVFFPGLVLGRANKLAIKSVG